jgi:hypothetical protein
LGSIGDANVVGEVSEVWEVGEANGVKEVGEVGEVAVPATMTLVRRYLDRRQRGS